jgi:hypothetical protein
VADTVVVPPEVVTVFPAEEAISTAVAPRTIIEAIILLCYLKAGSVVGLQRNQYLHL